MKVGEIFFPDDEELKRFKTECISDDNWTISYSKSDCRIATKRNNLSPFDMMRVSVQRWFDRELGPMPSMTDRFNRILVEFQPNWCTMSFMMANIVERGIQLCYRAMNFVQSLPTVISVITWSNVRLHSKIGTSLHNDVGSISDRTERNTWSIIQWTIW